MRGRPMPRPRLRRAVAGTAIIGLAVAGTGLAAQRMESTGAAAAEQALPRSDGETGATDIPALRTTTVERRDLVIREEFDGTLGYAGERAVSSRARGTLTWIVEEGATIRPGAVLFRADTAPVFWFSGGQPAWRTLQDGVDDGLDVRQLEQNLVALGYDPDGEITVDTTFDDATEAAVELWQEKTHQEETGVVELGRVVFLPGSVRRVGAVSGTVGGEAGGTVLTTTALRRVASFDVEAREAGVVREGQAVDVELPDGTTARGTIASVGRVATGSAGAEEPDANDSAATIEVSVSLKAAVDAFDQAPVTVTVETDAVRDAVSVPVGALLATAGGGFALEVVEGAGTRLVRVELGEFADGYVQVSGPGIEPGVQVVEAET